MDIYNFFVAHPEPNDELDISVFYPELKEWVSVRGKLERCGGRAGKVVRFNEKKYVSDIELGAVKSIELYSERKWGREECREILNCDFSAMLSQERLLLKSGSGVMDLLGLVESFLSLVLTSGAQDYAYAYKESHAYGFGYAVGIYMVDDAHPLLWSRGSEAGAWVKLQWSGETDLFIRDVYPLNLFSARKLSALPLEKKLALESAMKKYGVCEVRGKFTVWALDEHELEDARSELKAVELLASYYS